MYQALYRKYRPSTFDSVVGQKIVIKTLKNAIKNNKITHAYLFTGPRGTGKTSIAKIMSKIINCENLIGDLACDKCLSCIEINTKQSTDIIEIDAASNNGVDEIREIRSKVNLTPSISKYKIYIIDEVHMLSTGAFNALLKTLEEPPKHVIFILATTEPHKIPTTILSRCQRFDFKKIEDSEMYRKIEEVTEKEKIKIEELAIQEIARLSDGGMRDALSLLDKVISYNNEKITIEDVHNVNGTITQSDISKLIVSIIKKEISETFNIIETFNETGKDIVKLTEEITYFLKNVLIFNLNDDFLKQSVNDTQIYKNVIESTNYTNIINMIDAFMLTLNEMKKTSNPKLQFELTIIKLMNVLKEQKNNEKNEEKKEKNISQEIIESNKQVPEKVEIKEKEKKVIKLEIETKVEVADNNKKEKLKNVTKIRINNTLSNFSKKDLLDLKPKIEEVSSYILNDTYSQVASLVLDAQLKAASDKNLIFVLDTELQSDLFNEQLIKIEEMLEKSIGNKFSVISTHSNKWEEIKQQFNNKLQKYEYIEEDFYLKDILNEEKSNEIKDMFSEIIEYQ